MASKKSKKAARTTTSGNARGARAVAAAADKAGKGKKAKGLATVGELVAAAAKKRGGKLPAAAEAAVDNAETVLVGKPYTERLPVPLDEHDEPLLRAKADELAGVILDRLDVKEERREAMARFKERMAHLDERERDLALEVKQKVKLVDVRVEKRLNRRKGKIQIFRLDTGKMVGEKDATAKELQQELGSVDTKPRGRVAPGKQGTLLDVVAPNGSPTRALAEELIPDRTNGAPSDAKTDGEAVDAELAGLEGAAGELAAKPLEDEGEGVGHERAEELAGDEDMGAEHVSEPH